MSQISVMFFCLGNICRSPLAHGVFQHLVAERGLVDQFLIDSSGTSAYHVGEQPDPGSIKVARRKAGLDITDQRAQQLTERHLQEFDVLVAMDASNRQNAQRLISSPPEIHLLRDFEPDTQMQGLDVPDPWGGGMSRFEEVYEIVERCSDRLLDWILEEHL